MLETQDEAANQSEWGLLAAEAEARIEALAASLEEVRSLMRRLAQLAAPTAGSSASEQLSPDLVEPSLRLIEPEAEAKPGAWPKERYDGEWSGRRASEPASTAADPASNRWETSAIPLTERRDEGIATRSDAEPVSGFAEAPDEAEGERADIRRAVEAARAELAAGTSLVEDAPSPAVDEAGEAGLSADDARDEVRRLVETARAEREAGVLPIGAADVEDAPDEADSADDPRDEVRRLVETARAEMEAGVLPLGGAYAEDVRDEPDSADDPRDEVRRLVEAARAEMEAGVLPLGGADVEDVPVEPDSVDDPRDEVRRLVEAARAEIGAGVFDAAPANSEDETTDGDAEILDPREEVRRAVELARADLESGGLRPDSRSLGSSVEAEAADGDTLDEREEVRLAVTRMRLELDRGQGSGLMPSSGERLEIAEQPAAAPLSALQEAWRQPERTLDDAAFSPPLIIIEDGQRHVDLAGVYEVLSRLGCTETASLLNYAPHSVSIGLSLREEIPTAEVILATVQAVFGLPGVVSQHGHQTTVRLGEDKGWVA